MNLKKNIELLNSQIIIDINCDKHEWTFCRCVCMQVTDTTFRLFFIMIPIKIINSINQLLNSFYTLNCCKFQRVAIT